MTNAEKFKCAFGLYATELWAMDEDEMLKWLNAECKEPERKKGRWIYHPEVGWGETWLCSECGEKTTSTVMGKPRYKWCPMCGSDMREEGDS